MISIVIPTKNSESKLAGCLESIKSQTYRNYELIIVDAYSRDATAETAKQAGAIIIQCDCGRSEARNLGFSKAKGDIFVSIDSDMVLEKTVLQEIAKQNQYDALIIPEIGETADFFSRCKDLEKRCYSGDEIMESARAFSRKAFTAVGGYDPNLVFGEDWDIHQRIKKAFPVGRINSRIIHKTAPFSFSHDLRKSYLYGKTLSRYLDKGHPQAKKWLSIRGNFFVRHFKKLSKDPVHAIGLFFMKSAEYAAGFLGFTANLLPP